MKRQFCNNEIYHIFNRGVDKRPIFNDVFDLQRFLKSMDEFNTREPIGSIYENRKKDSKLNKEIDPLVDFICYCLNPNHFHFLLRQKIDGGISEFMKRIGGYTYYFNEKYKRSGALFQGKYKAVHVENNTQLLHLSAYINLNNMFSGGPTSTLSKSSWIEYCEDSQEAFCDSSIILEQFLNLDEYKKFALSSLEDIIKRKEYKYI